MHSASIHGLLVRECASRHEGVVPSDVSTEPWAPHFLKLILGEDGEGLEAVATALCTEGE